MNRAVIGIGSNIRPKEHVSAALSQLRQDLHILATSHFVRTKAIEPCREQPDFLNGAILIETPMSRPKLKAYLRRVEKKLGRTRSADKYAPRTIDLDIIVWNDRVVDENVYTRDFLRKSVLEICPEMKQVIDKKVVGRRS